MSLLIQYGTAAFIGLFDSPEPVEHAVEVLVRTPRGLEVGTVLCSQPDDADRVGEVVRRMLPSDREQIALQRSQLPARIQEAESLAQSLDLPVTVLDIEWLVDDQAFLHLLPWQDFDATPLVGQLAASWGTPVRIHDIRQITAEKVAEPAEAGCGKPDCGSGGGGCSTGGCGTSSGCSTGSCSKGKVKSADELTEQFRDLRLKMEQQFLARVPLG